MRFGLPPEPGLARREANNHSKRRNEEEGGNAGETWFPPVRVSLRRSRRER